MMNYFKYLTLLPVLFILFLGCKCTSALTKPVKEVNPTAKMDLYLLIGQSNMAGRAVLEPQDKDTLINVFVYTGLKDNLWEKAANPLNKYSSIRKKISMQRLSPAYTFGKEMAEATSGKRIGLIVNARGGTSIDLWEAGSEYYNEAVNRTKAAMEYGELKGIAWHQGETDAKKHATYLPKMKALIEALRLEFKQPNLPFVVGQISPDKPMRLNFNQMIMELLTIVDKVSVVSTENTSTVDSTHFDAVSQRLLGERYAKAMQQLLLE